MFVRPSLGEDSNTVTITLDDFSFRHRPSESLVSQFAESLNTTPLNARDFVVLRLNEIANFTHPSFDEFFLKAMSMLPARMKRIDVMFDKSPEIDSDHGIIVQKVSQLLDSCPTHFNELYIFFAKMGGVNRPFWRDVYHMVKDKMASGKYGELSTNKDYVGGKDW